MPRECRRIRPERSGHPEAAYAGHRIDALNRLAATLDLPTLTDLGYENADPSFRHPVKKPQGCELTEYLARLPRSQLRPRS